MAASSDWVVDVGTSFGESPVLEPLKLNYHDSSSEAMDNKYCTCIFCDETFNNVGEKLGENELLKHLLIFHKFVIADTNLITDLSVYVQYWKKRFQDQPITDFCTVINTNTDKNDTAPKEQYYLLCDILPEDKEIRQKLQKSKLENILKQQQSEREDSLFSQDCLFCAYHLEGNRADLFTHMATEHGFNIGHSDNVVFVREFLEKLKEKLDNLQCLHCEKTFKDRPTLKEHMRKKLHRKINPKNKSYDKYYVINYLELGKNWENLEADEDITVVDDSDEIWDDWTDEAGAQAMCLFCEFSSCLEEKLKSHMLELHDFDLQRIQKTHTFYQQVKIINYIRRQIHQCVCIACQERFQNKTLLLDHMHERAHTNYIPCQADWDQPQYFFPTYENDNLLYLLNDDDDDE